MKRPESSDTELAKAMASSRPPTLPDFGVILERVHRHQQRQRLSLILAPIAIATAILGGFALANSGSATATDSQILDGADGKPTSAEYTPSPGPPFTFPTRAPSDIAILRPYGPPLSGTESMAWLTGHVSPRDRFLDVLFHPDCLEMTYAQVRESDQQIVVRLVRKGVRSHHLCGGETYQRINLSGPIGDRQIVHDDVYDLTQP